MQISEIIGSQNVMIGVTILVTIASTLLFLGFKKKSKGSIDMEDLINDSKETWDTGEWTDNSNGGALEEKNESKLRNVFDVKQPPPNVGATKVNNGTEKPFKSSYYYAHNHLKKTGGYTDGLKAEDYVMNGPKLLNKSSSVETTSSVNRTSTKKNVGSSIPINRYLWDDEGNSNGIAKIYIGTLPGNPTLSFGEANISKDDVIVKLVGDSKNSMILQIRRKMEGEKYARYHLYIARLFGEVEEVKTIVKAKKLIVKFIKKKTSGNLKVWPQLSSKAIKSGTSDGVDYANEDLFL